MSIADRRIVVLCGHGIEDPLVSTLMLDYILRVQEKRLLGEVMLVTEERRIPELPEALAKRLEAAHVIWRPMRYDVNGRQFVQKARNAVVLVWRALRFVNGARERVVVGFLSMASSYASLLRSLGFTRSVVVNFEPHSRYMVEMGIWKEGGVKERLVSWFERRQLRNADVVIAPSTAVQEFVAAAGTRAQVHLQGVTIDVQSNARNEQLREHTRRRLGMTESYVVLYIGKFKGIYHSEEEYVRFMRSACTADRSVHHLIITYPEHAEALRSSAGFQDVKDRTTIIGPQSPSDLAQFLSAADLGVIAVPPTPSQRYRSPVKTALYWAAGLPVLIAKGVSDDWWVARDEGIGIVVDDLTELTPAEFREGVERLQTISADALHERCRATAMRLRDTQLMVDLLSDVIPH